MVNVSTKICEDSGYCHAHCKAPTPGRPGSGLTQMSLW